MSPTEWERAGKLAALLRDYARINNCAVLCAVQEEKNWGVYNERDILCSSRDGITQSRAKQYAINWNDVTNTTWYTAKPMPVKLVSLETITVAADAVAAADKSVPRSSCEKV